MVVITEGKGGVSIFQPYAPSLYKALKKDSAFRTSKCCRQAAIFVTDAINHFYRSQSLACSAAIQ